MNSNWRNIFIVIIFTLQIHGGGFAYAQEQTPAQEPLLSLFSEQKINADYDNMVQTIHPGSRLSFSDKKIYTVDSILGQGRSNLVLAIRENPELALRIPLRKDLQITIEAYNIGYRRLRASQVSIIELLTPANREYSLVEKIKGSFITFQEFLDKTSQVKNENSFRRFMGKNEIAEPYPSEEILQKFIVFSKALFTFAVVGDMHRKNLIYDFQKKKWLLIDWVAHENAFESKSPYHFRDANPLRELLHSYGVFVGDQFYPYRPTYHWFIPSIQEALKQIQMRRQLFEGAPFGTIFCAGAL